MKLSLLLASFGLLVMTGCGINGTAPTQAGPVAGFKINGSAHGGVYPVQNATVNLMETQSNGYGGQALLLQTTTSDISGYFTFSDTSWSCDPGQFIYVTVTGGTTTKAANNDIAQIGIVGSCSTNLATQAEFDAANVFVSELSTIAAAYTLNPFINVEAANMGAGTEQIDISAPANNNAASGLCTPTGVKNALNCTAAGLTHGFANAFNLVDSVTFAAGAFPTGQARTTPPTNAAAGLIPQAMINTLGNILQSCVDSVGGKATLNTTTNTYVSDGSHCGDLFALATPPGGTAPRNTLQAALNMAKYPTNNAAALFALQPRAVFFTPKLASAPSDLSLSIFYLTQNFGAYTNQSTTNFVYPEQIALDANDDVFVLTGTTGSNTTAETALFGMASNGQVLFTGPPTTTYVNPVGLAVDTVDHIWITNNDATNGAVLKADPHTGAISVGTTLANAAGLAVDRGNNIWASIAPATATTAPTLQEYTNSSLIGSATPVLTTNALQLPVSSLVVDGGENIWGVTSSGSSTATALNLMNTNTVGNPTYGSTLITAALTGTAGYGVGVGVEQDPVLGTNFYEAFFPLANQVDDANVTSLTVGTVTTATVNANNQGAYTNTSTSSKFNAPNQVQVDGVGSAYWADLEASGKLYQFIPSSDGATGVSSGTVNALIPCYADTTLNCYIPAVANVRSMQVDSTGALWSAADATYYGYAIGVVIQTFGVGAPSWPQLSMGRQGVMPH